MNSSLKENVRRIAKEKGIGIMKMESDLGFSEHYISKWDKYTPSIDKGVGWVDRRQGSNPCFSAKHKEKPPSLGVFSCSYSVVNGTLDSIGLDRTR